MGQIRRLERFFAEVLLTTIPERVVIFIDEIDATLGLEHKDDFFAALRAMYDERAREENFKRLSFVLVGVATPSELIENPKRTPFNVGQRVEMTDFTFQEALPLAAGFDLPEAEARQLLGWILNWTGGHPYLTQNLCKMAADQNRAKWTEADVATLVNANLTGEAAMKDNNIQFVRDMLIERGPKANDDKKPHKDDGKDQYKDEDKDDDKFAILSTYHDILERVSLRYRTKSNL